MYKPNPDCYANMFAIPNCVLDTLLDDAPLDAIKTILWIFKHPTETISIDALTKALAYSADEAIASLDFWVSKDVLSFIDEAGNIKYIPKSSAKRSTEKNVKEDSKKLVTPSSERSIFPSLSFSQMQMKQIIARMNEDDQVCSMLTEAESILGRTLGQELQSILIHFLDTFGLPKEVILTLLQHLAEIEKCDTRSILRIGKIWIEKEITTIEDANEWIQNDNEVLKLYNRLKIEAGFHAEKPTPKQSSILNDWVSMHLPFDMILDAYEESVERNIKYPIPYMDKILRNWKEKNITSKDEAKELQKQNKNPHSASKNNESSFDLDEAVRKATFSAKQNS